jgi:regulator of CtrA degradation
MNADSPLPFTRKVIDSLHIEAMLLADEARSYFDNVGLGERSKLDPTERVIFSCEALKVTTRLMHSVAWLLAQRARTTGELIPRVSARLGRAASTEAATLITLPFDAQHIIGMSEDLYSRIARLDDQMRQVSRRQMSPAHTLQKALERAF